MKKLIGILILISLAGVILLTGCRPPEIEGAVVDIQHGLYDKAFDNLQIAVKKYPNNAEAWYLLGTLYGRKDNFEKMNECFNKSLEISPQFKKEIEQLRFNYFANNYNEGLKNYYMKARDEQDPQKRKELFKKAVDKFLKAHYAAPDRVEPLQPLSIAFVESGDTTNGEKFMEKALSTNPQNDTLLVTVGDFYYRIGKTDKAIPNYEQALKINPNNVMAHISLGELYSKEQNWDKAIEHFDAAMKLAPENEVIPMNIAVIYYNNGKYEEALPYIKKTLELSPDNKDMWELLSVCYLQKANVFLEKYNSTDDPAKQKEYKAKYEEIYREALPQLEEAIQKFPDSSLLWNNIGVIYAQLGNKAKAEEAFKKSKELEEKSQ